LNLLAELVQNSKEVPQPIICTQNEQHSKEISRQLVDYARRELQRIRPLIHPFEHRDLENCQYTASRVECMFTISEKTRFGKVIFEKPIQKGRRIFKKELKELEDPHYDETEDGTIKKLFIHVWKNEIHQFSHKVGRMESKFCFVLTTHNTQHTTHNTGLQNLKLLVNILKMMKTKRMSIPSGLNVSPRLPRMVLFQFSRRIQI
jgi:hypothetical protein